MRPNALRCALQLILSTAASVYACAEEPISLRLPIACEIGRNCLIQYYPDADPSAGARDYQCGTLSYDGHNGTDFRVPTLAAQQAGVDVLAAAPGRVLRRRDGLVDRSVRETGKAALNGAECGNGLVIDHGGGWETQYCHMARGSLRVAVGDEVGPGQPIGRVGLSGLTEYPHLHFIVRHRGQIVDPFAHGSAPDSCGGGRMLWQPPLAAALAYQPRAVLNAGFAATAVTMESVEAGQTELDPPGVASPALVAYVRTVGLKISDVQLLRLLAPSGELQGEYRSEPLPRHRAQSLVFVRSDLSRHPITKGIHTAEYAVFQGDAKVLERRFAIEIK